jgi:hypothetical protein
MRFHIFMELSSFAAMLIQSGAGVNAFESAKLHVATFAQGKRLSSQEMKVCESRSVRGEQPRASEAEERRTTGSCNPARLNPSSCFAEVNHLCEYSHDASTLSRERSGKQSKKKAKKKQSKAVESS